MRVNRLLADAVATLAAATLLSIDAGGVAQAQDACARIRSACLAAGFRQGAARAGRGVEFDCIDPILQHRPAPARAVLPLPRVNPSIVAACLNPAAARRATGAQAVAPKHATSPASAALPTNAAVAASNAAPPTNATASTNAALPAPTNAALPTNPAPSANATAPTDATAPSAVTPRPGIPNAVLGALAALVAASGVSIFLAMRRRRRAAAPPASASATGPTSSTAASSTSPVPAPAPQPGAPSVVAAGSSPAAALAAAAAASVAAAPVGDAAAAGPPSRAHDVFISYSSQDKPVADAVCAILEQQRVRCWITPRDVRPGEEWAGAIVRAIAGARVVVLIFSASSNASPQVLREIERAVHGGATIIPFRIQDTPPSESLEYFISTPHWLDALTPPLEQHALRLAESIKSLLAQAPP